MTIGQQLALVTLAILAWLFFIGAAHGFIVLWERWA